MSLDSVIVPMIWHYIDEDGLPEVRGRYLTSYYPCHGNRVDYNTHRIDFDLFNGYNLWSKNKYYRVYAWAETIGPIPSPYERNLERLAEASEEHVE